MRNLEAKFRLANHSLAHRRALEIGFEPYGILIQRDTFFIAANGKLKLREQAGESWLIHYRRGEQRELQLSNYTIVPVSDPVAMRTMLANALGLLAEVRKHRTLMMRRNVRFHLDRVEGLGDFGEVEAVLADDDVPQTFHDEVARILADLGVAACDLIEDSYFELMKLSND
jgi:predicted adenylyl cyclase CyaB